jgi:MFS family permease
MRNQRWLRIMPTATVMYCIAFINRTNVSQALPSISRTLHMNTLQAGAIAGVFFWGYLLLQVPGGYLASTWSTKWLVSILLIVWGTCAIGTGLVRNFRELWLMRLALGIAEGGMYPATLILLSHWFPRKERARAAGLFLIAVPLSMVFSSPLSGWLLDRWGWRVMLGVEGAFPLVWLFVWLSVIRDYPRQAKWVSEAEYEYLENEHRLDIAAREPRDHEIYLRSLFAPQVLLMALIALLSLTGQFGYLFWLPSAIEKTKSMSNLFAGMLYTIPFLIGAASMILNSSHSDKTHERRLHVAVPLALGGFVLFSGVLISERFPMLAFLLVCLAAIGPFAWLGPFWAMPTERFSRKMAGSVAGLVNGVGNLGGFCGPLLVGYLNKRTGNFSFGFGVLAALMLIGAALCFGLRDSTSVATNIEEPLRSGVAP